jgi:hypothetical protein
MSKGSINTKCIVCGNLDPTHADGWQGMQSKLGCQRIVKYLDLREAASRGCEVCSVVLEGIEAFRDILGRIGKETQVFFRCNPPVHPLQVGIQENKGAGARWLEFFTLAGKQTELYRLITEKDKLYTDFHRQACSMVSFWSCKLCARKSGC